MKLSIKNIVLLLLMLATAALGTALRPRISLADELPPIDLAAMVPTVFGDWHEQLNLSNLIVDPVQKEKINKIYSQALSRSYVNAQGYRIMLSIAYGNNQSKALEMHKPEVCYPAQGFELVSEDVGRLAIVGRPIPVTRLVTSMGQRHEPVTYWAVIGEYITTSHSNKRWIEMSYALRGRIPDGMLVRVSSIDRDDALAFQTQERFAQQLFEGIKSEEKTRFFGKSETIHAINQSN